MANARTALLLIVALAACEESGNPRGLPPASKWTPPKSVPSVVGAGARPAPADPDDEDTDEEDPDDPHAGLDMDSDEVEDPHAAPDTAAGEPLLVTGHIRASTPLASGTVIFLSARPVDPATGAPTGKSLAVDKLTVEKLPADFSLEVRAQGPIQISARVDSDGEATTHDPTDLEGTATARQLPASDLDIVLRAPPSPK